MTRSRWNTPVRASFLQVGTEIIPVFGDNESGWSLESGIEMERVPIYRTVDELYFALINMQISTGGDA